jgi:NADPH:quinone reductase-like Zn-dependent oxidoreductase
MLLMKALVCERYGPPDVLQVRDVDRPVPRGNELLVRVHAATVNRTDSAYVKGIPFFVRLITGLIRPRHTTPGTEFAGEVVEIGKDVTRSSVGDRVFGFNDIRATGRKLSTWSYPTTGPTR